MKALTLLQDYYHDIIYFTDKNNIDEAIAELEVLQQPKSCDGCKYGKFGADSRGIEVECTLIWHCARGNIYADRYEPKEQ